MVNIVLKQKYKNKARNPKLVVGAVVKPKRRYPRTNIKRLANQIARVNTEKKEWSGYGVNGTVGQIYVGSAGANPSSGHYLSSSFTPLPSNGTTDTTRIGDEIKVTGMLNVLQFSHMANASQGMKVKVMFIAPKFGISGATLSVDKVINSNPIIYNGNASAVTVYDTMSARNQDYLRDFRILRTKTFYMPPDTASLSQKVVKTVKVGLKFKKPWEVRFDSAGAIAFGQIWCLILAESGNTTSNVPSANTAGIPIYDTLSALNFQYYTKSYFMDS